MAEESRKAYINCNNVNTKRCYGFKTLLFIASYCCPSLRTKQYHINNLRVQRTPDETIEPTNHFNFNKYIHHNLVFVKSGMGTGKTYSLHDLPRDASCVFLSSRKAFANSQSFEFKNDGFVNYMDKNTTYNEQRIIISLESIHRLRREQYDYLIIDESESIFNIISSTTLIKNCFIESVRKLEKIIQMSKKVIVMDAFLSERSIQAVKGIKRVGYRLLNEKKQQEKKQQEFLQRKQELLQQECIDERIRKENQQKMTDFHSVSKINASSTKIEHKNETNDECVGYYVYNPYPAPERTASIVNKSQLVGEMVKKLNKNERCVFVCGSRVYADWVLKHIRT